MVKRTLESLDERELYEGFQDISSVFTSEKFKTYKKDFFERDEADFMGNEIINPYMSYVLHNDIEELDSKVRQYYYHFYRKVFVKGREYFLEKYDIYDLYQMTSPKLWIKKLHRLYIIDGLEVDYHFIKPEYKGGWRTGKTTYLNILSERYLEQMGLAAGICHAFELFAFNNKEVFKHAGIKLDFKLNDNESKPVGGNGLNQTDYAMVLYYNDVLITTENNQELAEDNGYESEYSGKKLQQERDKYHSDQVKCRGSKQKNINLKKKLELIIDYIDDDKKEKVLKHIEIVKENIDLCN